MSQEQSDKQWMLRALELAKKGVYTTRPNPHVGCVIVQDGLCVGEGFHERAGEAHAEVHALKQAGAQAVGATCYVTLEPCTHYGRTPPCMDALIEARVARVVIATCDVNPLVAGKSAARLREAGIAVTLGVCEAQARDLNASFFRRMQHHRPYVRLKMACSLDGKVALENGASKWITSEAARADVQSWRARACALVTGVQTIIQDNPRLNVRYDDWARYQIPSVSAQAVRSPIRVVLDTSARLTPDYDLFKIPTPIFLLSHQAYACHFPQHVRCLQVPLEPKTQRLCLVAVLELLAQEQINEVLIEAGGTLAGAFWQQGLCDELLLYQAPKILGSQAQNLLSIPSVQSMQDVETLTCIEQCTIGTDIRFRFAIK
tara:strand:- start:276 stop:1397 length:1122 start_codon:yes stop_codon:yes gene_type:complete